MLHDEPTLSDLSDAPTLPRIRSVQRKRPPFPYGPLSHAAFGRGAASEFGRAAGSEPGERSGRFDPRNPIWPIPRPPERRPAERGRSPFGWALATVLGASAVLLLSVLSLLAAISLTGHTDLFGSSTPARRSTTAIATASPSAGSAPTSAWLQVAPVSVQFGCADHQRTQIVVLQNHGPRIVHWQATVSVLGDQAGVAISPGDGELGAGESTAIQLQSTGPVCGFPCARSQEVIHFSVTDAQASPPASVSITTAGCN